MEGGMCSPDPRLWEAMGPKNLSPRPQQLGNPHKLEVRKSEATSKPTPSKALGLYKSKASKILRLLATRVG